MKTVGITPIVDLCHFGVPDWIEDFQNPFFSAYLKNMPGHLPLVTHLSGYQCRRCRGALNAQCVGEKNIIRMNFISNIVNGDQDPQNVF